MPGLADFFRQAIGQSRHETVDAIRGAAAIADTFEAFSDKRAQVLLLDVILPWATTVARMAARKWNTRKSRCGFDSQGPCRLSPVAECLACGRPVCMLHAFVGADATVICWPCMKAGAANARPWVRGRGYDSEDFDPGVPPGGPSPWEPPPAESGAPPWQGGGSPPEPEPPPFDKHVWAYAVLGVKPEASDDEVRAAHKKASFENHPDRASDPQDANMRAEKFKMIQLAMQVIKQQRGIP